MRIYDAGKKKLLRKTEYRGLPTHVAMLSAMGERIYAGDLQVREGQQLHVPDCCVL